MVLDVNGLQLGKGDMVAPITGDFKGKICAVKNEDGMGFVCVRASHRPYSKGIWYASEHVQRLQVAKVKEGDKGRSDSSKTAKAGKVATSAKTKTKPKSRAGR
ncbi:hypothetical protein HED60_20385 [Planctomycetales bacterium ZRK34]|nr:hypothetical protein HED60_20385 [Planctomycetales bacterium ZRK34]